VPGVRLVNPYFQFPTAVVRMAGRTLMAKRKQAAASAVPTEGADALLGQAVQCLQAGQAWQANVLCRQVLQLAPAHPQANYLLGMMAAQAGDFAEAVRCLTACVEVAPGNPAAHNNLGVSLRKLKRHAEAAASFARAAALKPDYAEAHFNLGNALRDLNRHAEASESYQRAAALHPRFAEARQGLAGVLLELGQLDRALAAADDALALRPDHADSHLHRGTALARMKRHAEALASFDAALALAPDRAVAHANRAGVLLEANRPEEAQAGYQRALALDASNLEAHEGLAMAATRAKRFDQAVASYERLYALAPDYPYAAGGLLHARMLCCDWRDLDTLRAGISAGLARGAPVAEPFGHQGIAESESELLACARIYAAAEFPEREPVRATPAGKDERLTIGYLCGEFRQHATTILMCGVFEAHDRARYRLIAFDNGGGDDSTYRRRVEAAFDEVVDIRGLGDRQAAELIAGRGVDVLVNLNGYYGEHRMGVFACRPAPVQVNYLGFPGTLGAPYIDYLIADDTVIPQDSRRHYSEKIAWLPGCYQANDDRRGLIDEPLTRRDAGLPDDAFVYCCFNNTYKITPSTFDGWMRILQRVPNSVLWLLRDNPTAALNLAREAEARGVDPGRLVFAPRRPPAQHLARHRLADLFLDTLPYGAHTTASDALWAGLPVLTRRGTTFPGRVGASLLQAVGLPGLIAESAEAFESLAVELAGDPPRLAALRQHLREGRAGHPLFDTAAFTRHLEHLYEQMVERQRAGLPPAHLGEASG
jgi:predicted O-linked N-acetylglucosamine transferase (SPINDLY family)